MEYFFSKCLLIFLPAVQSKNTNDTGRTPAQIRGCQKSEPPIRKTPMSINGKRERYKTENEKMNPNGSPINTDVHDPILSRFFIGLF